MMPRKGPFRMNCSSRERQGWEYRQGYGPVSGAIRAKIIPFPVSSFRFRCGPANFFTVPGLAGSPLSISGDPSARVGVKVWPSRSAVRLWALAQHDTVGRSKQGSGILAIRTLPKRRTYPRSLRTPQAGRCFWAPMIPSSLDRPNDEQASPLPENADAAEQPHDSH